MAGFRCSLSDKPGEAIGAQSGEVRPVPEIGCIEHGLKSCMNHLMTHTHTLKI